MTDRVAIVAASVVTALGADLPSTYRAFVEGRGAIAPVRGFDASAFGEPVAAQLSAPDAAADEGPTRVRTPHGRLLDLASRRAHDDARFGTLARDAIGLFAALPVVDSEPAALAAAVVASRTATSALDLDAFFATGFRAIHPLWPLEMLNNVALGQTAADLDIRGDNTVVSSEADAGASDHVCLGALARARLRAVPGETLGEGAGALALELESSARARDVLPHAFVTGAGFAFERSTVGPGPSSDAIRRAVLAALAEAGRTTSDVALLLVEGTGVEEAAARRELFGARGASVAVVAPAMAIGHLRAGAAVVGAALACAILTTGTAPSTAHGRPRQVPRSGIAVILASGAGGQAAALVVEGRS